MIHITTLIRLMIWQIDVRFLEEQRWKKTLQEQCNGMDGNGKKDDWLCHLISDGKRTLKVYDTGEAEFDEEDDNEEDEYDDYGTY